MILPRKEAFNIYEQERSGSWTTVSEGVAAAQDDTQTNEGAAHTIRGPRACLGENKMKELFSGREEDS